MVECECVWTIGYGHTGKVLIDTWWNVNMIILVVPVSASGVLIDTWWNVNDKPRSIFRSWSFVLIDTWWNVNVKME